LDVSASGLRVGIDLVQISQVIGSIDRFGDRFVQRLFTPDEIAYCRAEPKAAGERFAARFAAKEATVKVLRPEGGHPDPRSIEVRRAPSGYCELVLHGEAQAMATRAGLGDLAVSMSHEADLATAIVIASPRRGPKRARASKAPRGS
jgi:holo-[acyl-carrier protein] synthase